MLGRSAPTNAAPDVDALQSRIVVFVREFGLHRPDLTPCGVPVSISQAHALTELAAMGSLTQSELGSALRLSKSTVSRLVGQLEEHGWVERDRGQPDDGRVVRLRLTVAGTRVSGRVAKARRARMARLLERIPEPDRGAVLRALNILVEAAHD